MRLIGVDVDRSESAAWIRQWSDEKGFDWPLAPYDEASVRDYNVARQSTAFGIDAAGVVALRKSGGLKDDGGWREWLDILAASRSTAAATTDGTAAATSAMGAPPAATPTQSAGTAPAAAITAPLATADAPTFPVPPPTFVPPPTPPFPVPPSSPFVPPPPRTPPVPTPAFVPQPPPPIAVPPTPPPRPTATPSAPVGSRVGDRAPDFTFDAVSGDSYQLSKITAQGSPVLLYFFATW